MARLAAAALQSPLLLPSASLAADGRPRFHLALDPDLASSDHGLRYLIEQETRHDGFERATREVIDAHLQPGDLFVDIGAHLGVMSLTAATCHDNPVLAVEPSPANLRQLAGSIAANGLQARIEIAPCAIGATSGPGRLRLSGGSMGHRLTGDGGDGASPESETIDVPLASLDDLLARYPQHAGRRVVVKIDAEGAEPEVIAGAAGLLASGRLRLLIWEKSTAMTPALAATAASLADSGLSAFVFPLHDWGGPLIPFIASPALGNVFCLAADERRRPTYPRDVARRPAYNAALGQPPAAEKLLDYIEALRQAGGSDGSRWSNWAALAPGARERAEAAAPFLPAGARLLDLGAGQMELRGRMPTGGQYRPADLVAWSTDCLGVDLNQGPFPVGRFEVVAALGLLEYLRDPAAAIAAARRAAYRLLVTYPPYDSRLPLAARRGYGWLNDIDLAGFEAMPVGSGWRIAQRRPVFDSLFWVCEAGPA
jgi:FkbM family methyltransferase